MQDMAPYVHEEVKGMDYELLYIIDPSLEEEPRKELVARYTALIGQHEGKVEKVEEWGKRRLAYLVNDKPEGYALEEREVGIHAWAVVYVVEHLAEFFR